MSIEFTQYMMPDGRKVPKFIDRPKEVEKKSKAVIEAGGAFEMEMLNVPPPLPNVSITCAYQDDDISHKICRNGPDVLDAIDLVVDEAHRIVVLGEKVKEEDYD